MPDLLLELLSEEIPARMQAQAARDLERMATESLAAADLAFSAIRSFAGPRRLTLAVDGLPASQADRREERKGPRVDAPDKAIEGFLRSTGLERDALTMRDGVFFAMLDRPGRPTAEIVAEMVEAIVRAFPWPKSMRWGSGTLRWVRPLKRIACILDGEVVPLAIALGNDAGEIAASNLTEGHRFLGAERAPFAVSGLEDYAQRLADRYVVVDPAERLVRIAAGVRAVCEAKGLEWVEDQGLLDEVRGLAEWPVPILGDMDAGFLDLPAEVISTSMRVHQRYFAVRDPATGKLAPHFVVVANIEPKDGGAVIAHGNARVLTARLADARFFWDQDLRASPDGGTNFDRWAEKLKGVTFHAKLGTMAERVERIAALAKEIAPLVGADPKLAETAARLCKLDLASGMVGEFPELQGVMGGYYVRAAGASGPLAGLSAAEIDQVADAVRDHYKPLGPSDTVPTAPVTVAVALADKLDTLVGFFAIDERPTGSKDPFAMRRAALGLIRLLLSQNIRLKLNSVASMQFDIVVQDVAAVRIHTAQQQPGVSVIGVAVGKIGGTPTQIVDLLIFFADRLKVLLRDEGKRHDLVDAVFALGDDDLVRIVRRVEALSAFLATDDGASLLAGYKRAANILKAEAKKAPGENHGLDWDDARLVEPQEKALSDALRTVQGEVRASLEQEDFKTAMAGLARLRAPVDAFFEHVLVNASEPEVRLNRLRLLAGVRDAANLVADFSKVSGG